MRILQVTPYFAPAWAYGGPPRVMYDYATGLVERGHEVSVLTTDALDARERARPDRERMGGVDVHRLPNLSNSLAWKRKKYLPRGLVRHLAREIGRVDIVHVTDTRTYLTATAYAASRARGVPLCLSPHGSLPGSAGLRGTVKKVYDRALVRPMLGEAALLLAQTNHEAELLRESGARERSVRLLPLPLDLDELDGGARGKLRQSLGIGQETRVILFLGRIHWLKGLDVLIDAVAPLLGTDTVLVIVGRDDGQWDTLAEQHRNLLESGRIRFAGPLYDRDRLTAYADADVFCLTPRHWEETSVAALEAAASGVPVVVTEQAEIPGLSESGGGSVVPLDPAAIRAAVEEALGDRKRMGAKAREHVRTQHDKDAVVARLESYLAEAVASPRPA
jgi:glycosyltransferase involved in cell wall biosynthesis